MPLSMSKLHSKFNQGVWARSNSNSDSEFSDTWVEPWLPTVTPRVPIIQLNLKKIVSAVPTQQKQPWINAGRQFLINRHDRTMTMSNSYFANAFLALDAALFLNTKKFFVDFHKMPNYWLFTKASAQGGCRLRTDMKYLQINMINDQESF